MNIAFLNQLALAPLLSLWKQQKRRFIMKVLKILLIPAMLFASIISQGCSDLISNPESADPEDVQNLLLTTDLQSFPFENISEKEKDGLLFLREEEKVARDIYLKMNEKHGSRIFNNISRSEQTHMDAIKRLLDKYEINDPIDDDRPGLFENQQLQDLYDNLLKQGGQSHVEGLKVGALIEEVDIIDLKEELDSPEVDNQDIRFVYNNLLKGSANHLRAFIKNLKLQGITYAPLYLDQDTFDKIVNGQL